ncbi:MAG: aminotransferase class III-fold pyridoxal phosphate-dependent enzyme [Gammaproteobacteria bacterium]|nr:aminotransferase class III-fold pyridoxal phosphate-dependent enzyme [Gammaproteobacteria bacterium]
MNEFITSVPITSILIAFLIAFIFYKVFTRLQLSRAKHPSLRGHAKWSRRISKLVPYFTYDEEQFFASDHAPLSIQEKRQQGFSSLAHWFKSNHAKSETCQEELYDSISDINFTSAYRVPFPFREHLNRFISPATLVNESKGVQLKDLDGNWKYDLTGSYGVNVFGYDFYKECIESGWGKVKSLGPVLGLYHPIIEENVNKLKEISGLDEVSFHMSGTEAVMQAVRLARYHTGKTHLVRFCGSYHGWWDGVQPGIGNQRLTNDVYTLSDMSEQTLYVLNTRNDIACILINPLQALHPNADASSDASLISSSRTAFFDKNAYIDWLKQLRQVCDEKGIVLIMDEVFTGFRLGYRGAQEFFGIQADMVTYGKSLGGGLPVGVVCGTHALMKRYKDDQPANISFARGTFNSHPMVMASMNEFLHQIETTEIQQKYATSEAIWNQRVKQLNTVMQDAKLPVKVENLLSICTILFTTPSRYNWMYQYYLSREGLQLSWIGSGRLIFSHNYSDEDFNEVIDRMVKAAQKMKADEWWWYHPQMTNKSISRSFLLDMVRAKWPLLCHLLPSSNVHSKNELSEAEKV